MDILFSGENRADFVYSCGFLQQEIFFKKEFIIFLLITVFFVGTFSIIFFLPRYILPVFPYFCIAGAYAIVLLLKNVKMQLLAVTAILVLFVTRFHGPEIFGTYDRDMQYVDVVTTHKQACNYVEKNFSGSRILALWPLSKELSEPYLGYVEKPVKVSSINDEYDIVLYTPQGDLMNEKLKDLIRQRRMVLKKIFEKNNKYVEIYSLN